MLDWKGTSPPRHELRNRGVYASTGRFLGYVAHLYVDDDRKLRLVDVGEASWAWEGGTT